MRKSPAPSFRLLSPHILAGHDLIPLKPRSKEPARKGWPSMAPMTADEAEVHMKAGGNVGIRLRDDQLVIDVDPRRAASDTDYPMSAFLERLGLSDADWPVVSTGGGGRHYY